MTPDRNKLCFCSKCHYSAPFRVMVIIMESAKGIMTGRYWMLCPTCRKYYFDREIANLPMSLEDKIKMTQWNQKETELFS